MPGSAEVRARLTVIKPVKKPGTALTADSFHCCTSRLLPFRTSADACKVFCASKLRFTLLVWEKSGMLVPPAGGRLADRVKVSEKDSGACAAGITKACPLLMVRVLSWLKRPRLISSLEKG